MRAQLNFVRQQGFPEATSDGGGVRYAALMFQPRLVGILVPIGLALQEGAFFLGLGVLLWWNAAFPRLNPFDALYNRLVANPRGMPRLEPAPPPRRFAQGMAGTLMVGIGLSLLAGWRGLAWSLEAVLVLALGALIVGRFCLGSYLYLLLTGRAELANRTLPWSAS